MSVTNFVQISPKSNQSSLFMSNQQPNIAKFIADQTIKWIQAPGFIRGKIKIFSLFQAPRFIDGVTLLTFDERKRLTS